MLMHLNSPFEDLMTFRTGSMLEMLFLLIESHHGLTKIKISGPQRSISLMVNSEFTLLPEIMEVDCYVLE